MTESFLLFPQCFQKICTAYTSKPGLVWERANPYHNHDDNFSCLYGKSLVTTIFFLFPPTLSKLHIYFRRRRCLKILLFFPFLLPRQPELWVEFNSLHNFGRASLKEHLCQVSSRLAPLVYRIVDRWTDGQTKGQTDGRRTMTDHNISPQHFVLR